MYLGAWMLATGSGILAGVESTVGFETACEFSSMLRIVLALAFTSDPIVMVAPAPSVTRMLDELTHRHLEPVPKPETVEAAKS